jgi:hypothetical protein
VLIMARSRNIKPGIMANERLAELPPEARLLFIYSWMLADREGRIEDRPKRIAAQALPYDRDVDVDDLLCQLATAGFITRYTVGDQALIQINNFTKHQSPHVRETASELPSMEQGTTKAVSKHNLGSVETSPRSPDSLIADSLIPEVHPPISPQGGNSSGEDSATQKKARQPRGKKQTFAEWADSIRTKGEKAISGYRPVWDYAERTGLPKEYIEIAWLRFKEKYVGGNNAKKTYVDWRAAFRDHVEGNYLGLWHWSERDGQYRLTTAGVQADRATEVAACA